jgi:hypothetical protein
MHLIDFGEKARTLICTCAGTIILIHTNLYSYTVLVLVHILVHPHTHKYIHVQY